MSSSSSWEREIESQLDRDGIPPVQTKANTKPTTLSRLNSKQRRAQNAVTAPTGNEDATAGGSLRPLAQRPIPPRIPTYNTQQQQPQQTDEDDPFAAHSSPPPQQQPYVHPLMQEPLRPSQAQPQQQQQQQQRQQPSSNYPPPLDRDPSMQRIENSLLETLSRDPNTFSSTNKQLPPLTRPAVPPLKLGDVINQVLGPRALTNPAAAPAAQDATQKELRDLVARKRLHESIAPTAAGDTLAGLEADKAGYLVSGPGLNDLPYDENDDDDDAGGSSLDQAHDERRPLSPRKQLPTSRIPIDPDDLARKPNELREVATTREELMHFRRNISANGGGGINNAASGGDANGMGATGLQQPIHVDTTKLSSSTKGGTSLQDTYVESKTTGEFIRVRHSPADSHPLDHERTLNHHNIQHFDRSIDTIIDTVNQIQAHISAVWLMMAGILVGACLIQVYLVYLRSDDLDFLSYYSALAGPARKVIYVLLGFSSTLSCWRLSLERRDTDRHIHYINRYYQPNASQGIFIRNVVCAFAFTFAFLMTLIMVPLDDYMESQYTQDTVWYTKMTELPDYFRDHITPWYGMAMVRMVFVAIGWLCMVHRFGRAEYEFLDLAQDRYENRLHSPTAAFTSVGGDRMSRPNSTGMQLHGLEATMPTARTSRLSASQRATGNGASIRMEPLNASAMAIPPRR